MAKRLLLISLVSFLSFNLFSQTSYHKMFGDTNRWYVSGYIFGVKPSGSQNITNVGDPCIGYYKTEKDSMYNSKLYKIFEPDQILFCVGGSSFFSKTLVREDTISKKIFILHPDSVNECVAMDFGMTIGDSIYLPYSTYSYALKNGYYKLDSIASRPEILGPRQHFYLSKHDAPINFVTNKKYYVEWIESVGATHFPINLIAEEQSNDFNMPYTCKKNQYSTYVTCKYTKGIKYYQDSCALKFVNTHSGYVLFGDNCEFYGYTGNVKALSFLNQVELFPNPSSSDHMTLRFKAIYYKPIEISIYNTLGQKIYHEKVNIEATENEIKLMNLNLKQGLYTLQINSEEETSSINFIKY